MPAEFWNKVVSRLWPVTFGVGVLITVLVLVTMGLAFFLVYGAAFSILTDGEIWRAFKE